MANPTPPPKAESKRVDMDALRKDSIAGPIISFGEEVFKLKFDLGDVGGALDPLIHTRAKKDSDSAKGWLKPGNALRHSFWSYPFGVFVKRLQGSSEKQTEPLKTGLWVVSEYLDSFRQEFWGKETGKDPELDKEGEAALKALQPILTKYYDILLRDWVSLLINTKASRMPELRKYLADSALTVHEMVDLLLNGPPKKEEPKVPFKERVANAASIADEAVSGMLTPINRELEQVAGRARAYNQRTAQEIGYARQARTATPQKWGPLGRFCKLLFKP